MHHFTKKLYIFNKLNRLCVESVRSELCDFFNRPNAYNCTEFKDVISKNKKNNEGC